MANKVEADFTNVTSGTPPTVTRTLGALTGVSGTHRLVIARQGANGTTRYVLTAASQADAGVGMFGVGDNDINHNELILRSNLAIDTYYVGTLIGWNTLRIAKVVSGVSTLLASVGINVLFKVVEFRFMALGSTLALSLKNITAGEPSFTTYLSMIDTSIPGAGAPGFGVQSNDSTFINTQIDNWRWYDVS